MPGDLLDRAPQSEEKYEWEPDLFSCEGQGGNIDGETCDDEDIFADFRELHRIEEIYGIEEDDDEFDDSLFADLDDFSEEDFDNGLFGEFFEPGTPRSNPSSAEASPNITSTGNAPIPSTRFVELSGHTRLNIDYGSDGESDSESDSESEAESEAGSHLDEMDDTQDFKFEPVTQPSVDQS
jgi:hypothetical protein